jgi:hypothetical protein
LKTAGTTQQLRQNGGFLLLLARVAQCLPSHGMNWLLLPSFKRKAASEEPLHELAWFCCCLLVVDAVILLHCQLDWIILFTVDSIVLKLVSTYTYLYL